MSEFIKSFCEIKCNGTTRSLKLYSKIHKIKWSVHLIPSFSIYVDVYSHKKTKKINGGYFSIKFLNILYTFGLYKNI